MIVVSNAGPIIALARIEHLFLLQDLYGELVIPTAVQQEVVCLPTDLPGAREVKAASWIEVVGVSDSIAVSFLRERLDAGESEAIVLVLERQADLLLIDEARGRRIAQAREIPHIGTLGILVLAKRRGLVETVTPLLNQLLAAGFRMDGGLTQTVKRLAGEE
ncbi:DUF3368 domain-containing protein [Nodosilinea nodulosa]|uniref:DUF3368 domain-containing protein n=1 Tax=Nodosilinea nodulosa TaxID=416001 RepID=UPI0002EF40F5|nr:DUF3368 domain-containing protein [Nodosilinea nodulosa]